MFSPHGCSTTDCACVHLKGLAIKKKTENYERLRLFGRYQWFHFCNNFYTVLCDTFYNVFCARYMHYVFANEMKSIVTYPRGLPIYV